VVLRPGGDGRYTRDEHADVRHSAPVDAEAE
jgi:hypothetical protein